MSLAADFRAVQPSRGYQPLYSAGAICPGCGHRAWWLHRRQAECGRWSTALPLAPEIAHG